jgi:hypothetical protein
MSSLTFSATNATCLTHGGKYANQEGTETHLLYQHNFDEDSTTLYEAPSAVPTPGTEITVVENFKGELPLKKLTQVIEKLTGDKALTEANAEVTPEKMAERIQADREEVRKELGKI